MMRLAFYPGWVSRCLYACVLLIAVLRVLADEKVAAAAKPAADSRADAAITSRLRVLKVAADPVQIDTGRVRGLIVGAADDVQAYRGIPYAAPPVGALRWQPPQPALAWSGVRACYEFGSAAPQKPVPMLGFLPGMAQNTPSSEDCLYLNVGAPARAGAKPLPVLVWIHGGGYLFGAASQSL